MAANSTQQERRSDTVAISRSTVKAASWLATVAFMAVGGYVWDSGTKINALLKDMEHIEEFAKVGDRFTSKDGEKMERRIERLEHVCESHRVTPGHREQVQLNREIIRRLEKLEQGK